MKAVVSFLGCHRRAGVERIMFECARHLASRGHSVTVLANEWEVDDTQPGIQYHYVPMRTRPSFLTPRSYYTNATRELASVSHDVLNTHGCVCPLNGVHWVQSVHKAWLERSSIMRGNKFSAGNLKRLANPLHPAILRLEEEHFRGRNYRKLLATTNEVKQDLHRIYQVPLADIEIVPNGFSPTEFSPENRHARRSSMREQLGLSASHTALLLVANELQRKGYLTILAALARLKNPDIRLLVVGKPSVAQVTAFAEQYGLANQVIACGSTRDVAGFHAAADLFVLPTQYEAFCLAILEALGSGLPVLTTNVPGAADAIVSGINGALIEDPNSGEELALAIQPFLDKHYRDRIAGTTAESVEGYKWPVVLSRYEAILEAYRN